MGELAEGEAEVRIVLAERSIAIGVKATSLPRMLVSQLASSVEGGGPHQLRVSATTGEDKRTWQDVHAAIEVH